MCEYHPTYSQTDGTVSWVAHTLETSHTLRSFSIKAKRRAVEPQIRASQLGSSPVAPGWSARGKLSRNGVVGSSRATLAILRQPYGNLSAGERGNQKLGCCSVTGSYAGVSEYGTYAREPRNVGGVSKS